MPRSPDAECAGGCGKLLWGGRTSLPAGVRCCQACRVQGRAPVPIKPPAPRPIRTCDVDGCDAKHLAKGMCRQHWRRSRYGDERKSVEVVLNSMASLRGAYFPKVKPVRAFVTVGVIVVCPACGCYMGATDPVARFCRGCGTTLTLNEEEVAWVISEKRSTAA